MKIRSYGFRLSQMGNKMKGYEYCGQQDSNLHGFPTGPKPAASANSAMTAWCTAFHIRLM